MRDRRARRGSREEERAGAHDGGPGESRGGHSPALAFLTLALAFSTPVLDPSLKSLGIEIEPTGGLSGSPPAQPPVERVPRHIIRPVARDAGPRITRGIMVGRRPPDRRCLFF